MLFFFCKTIDAEREHRKGKKLKPMKQVEVKVSAKVGEKKGEKNVSLNIFGENMADFTALATQYGSDATVVDGKEITPSEKKNPMLFLGNAVQNYLEYAKGIRNKIRNEILESIEGPTKTIAKTAKSLVDGGLFADLESATKFVVEQRKAKGLPV